MSDTTSKPIIYQVFTRLFGNTETRNKPWGTIEENGVGKFSHFNDAALKGIRELGVTHIWYTGIPHHAVIRDYSDYGISADDPDVVKGRAGSPYAVKDYYNVSPDLADDPNRRLDEFRALIQRTHDHGMQVIIDIVPNHVARSYESLGAPEGVEDFGASDNTSVEYARDNNFYYVIGENFEVPEAIDGYAPLGGEAHPLADGQFTESPAKWTGNGARAARPRHDDWYETVKVNYGVRPDGTHDFPSLPESLRGADCEAHRSFWSDQDLPDSWLKFRDIGAFWLSQGVDGFRYDMAELVPVEFWSFMNCSMKAINPDALLLAEVYDPTRYRDYLAGGKMDYLYDKVGFYDTLRPAMADQAGLDTLPAVHASVADIADHMLHFLENHDEQRIASAPFAGSAKPGIPGMAISALISKAPVLIYFGQEVGEPGDDDAGFGSATRTTIFDYWGVPNHQAWMNGGRFDGAELSDGLRALRADYARLMQLANHHAVASGHYEDLHAVNRRNTEGYSDRLFSFARWHAREAMIVIASLERTETRSVSLEIPAALVEQWRLKDGRYPIFDRFGGNSDSQLLVRDGIGRLDTEIPALGVQVWSVGLSN